MNGRSLKPNGSMCEATLSRGSGFYVIPMIEYGSGDVERNFRNRLKFKVVP
jgi:hypothetical protein